MFLKELVEKKRVCFHESFETWEDAIKASCQPLLDDHTIEENYIQEIIDCVYKYGPYIVIAPDIAMPHSQEGVAGVNDTAISFMKVEKPVHFEEGNPEKDARLFFTLASKDHNIHLENMSKLATLLSSDDVIQSLLAATCEQDLLDIMEPVEE